MNIELTLETNCYTLATQLKKNMLQGAHHYQERRLRLSTAVFID